MRLTGLFGRVATVTGQSSNKKVSPKTRRPRRIATIFAVVTLGWFMITPAAADQVNVANVATLQYEINSSRFYIRNFITYDGSWLPCCYNYWIDLTTDQGKAMMSLVLTKMASGQPLSFYVSSKTTGGAILAIGYYGY